GLGSVLTAFAEHLNRPFVGYTSHGDSMTKELIYDQAALDRAKAEGVALGKSEASASLTDLRDKLTAAGNERQELLAAFAALGKDNAKVEVFVEALNEGGSDALASKLPGILHAPMAASQAPAVPKTSQQA